MTLTRLVARPLIASAFFVGAVNALKNAEAISPKARKITDTVVPPLQRAVPQAPIPTDPTLLVRINAATQLLAAAALATGRLPRLSSTVLAVSVVPTTIAGHPFWEETDPQARTQQRLHFFKNLSMLGGLLLASVDTEGKPGMAWRAQRAARDVRREARNLGRTASLETRLAAQKVS